MTSATILRQLDATIFQRIFSTMAYQFPERSFQSLQQGDHNATASKRVVASSSKEDTTEIPKWGRQSNINEWE